MGLTAPPSASKLPVTTEGGAEAKWSKDGKQLFYVNLTVLLNWQGLLKK